MIVLELIKNEEYQYAVLTFVLTGAMRIINSIGLSLIFVYYSEFFPTCLRCIGLGSIGAMSILGHILSNLVINLDEDYHNISVTFLLIVVVTCLISIVVNKYLPETLGRNLRDQIDEVNIMHLDYFSF